MPRIRKATDFDKGRIWELHARAFETIAEADLVNTLGNSGIDCISLIAEADGKLCGHILFTPVSLGEHSDLKLMGLAPLAVTPSHQRQGIGSRLVRAGLEQCRAKNYDAVVVLGHPAFYPRFGFVSSVRYGIRSEYAVPDEVFMVLELREGALRGKSGIIRYHAAFADL